MKARTLIIMMALFLLGAAATAQPASEIDNCCFVDRNCQNEADWVAGYWAFQNNQCSAPSPQQSSAPSSPQPAAIDNCCFAGWQCLSDQQWADGYFAYQNGQCAAPQPQSAAPSSPQPTNIDNCCFAGWQCSTDGDWRAGHSAYQSNHCVQRPIRLNGSANFVFWMNAALDMLRASAPEWYVYVITGLNEILQKPDHEMINIGAYVDLGSATMAIAGYHDAPFQNAPSLREREIFTYLASVMVHEACHVQKWRAGIWYDEGWRNELPCHETELSALHRFLPAELSWIIAREQEIINNYRQHRTWWGAGPYPFS
ncbi:MAG: hypothetical protein OXN88_08780 [Chloroflexota bacterium]|nr:hypothetical protein [Chloroflexota bacterium]